MDKFERRLNQVNMLTPPNIPASTIQKQTDPQRSYISLNDFNRHQQDSYENEIVNLRSQVQILEGKLVFYDKEFQIKQTSLEKRIQTLIQTSAQLTQQNTQLQLQMQSLLSENQQMSEKLYNYEKGANNFDEKVRSQLDSASKYQEENNKLTLYANQCRERSKVRKGKIKDLQTVIVEQQQQLQLCEREYERINNEKEQQALRSEQEILSLQEQNEELRMNYEQLLVNVKHHLTEADDQSEYSQSQQQQQQAIKNTQNDQYMQKLHEQIQLYEALQSELSQLINKMQNISESSVDQFNNPLINQLAQIFSKLIDKLITVSEKKIKYKQQARELAQSQQQQRSQSQQGINFEGDQRTKYLFEQRILELEQFYQKDRERLLPGSDKKQRSLTVPFSTDKRLVDINRMLANYLEGFIKLTDGLRELNIQLNISTYENSGRPIGRKFRKSVWCVIAVIRWRSMSTHHNGNLQFQFKYLKIEMPLVNTLQQFLELVGTQQQLIDTLQSAIQQNKSEFDDDPETQQQLESELRTRIKSIQTEFDSYKNIMLESQRKYQQEIEYKDQQISELEKECEYLKEVIQQDDKPSDQAYQDQLNRVKEIEHEFISLTELIEQLQL